MAVRKNSRRLGASNSSLATPAPVRGAGSVRIVSGKWKRSVVPVACAEGLRPTSERVRETVFDWLTHLFGTLEGCDALDMFAGSGAMGLEAASRGADYVDWLDIHRQGIAGIRQALTRLGADDHKQARVADAFRFLQDAPRSYDVIFIDPPFSLDMQVKAARAALGALKEEGLLYVESPMELLSDEALESLGVVRVRSGSAGAVRFELLAKAGSGMAGLVRLSKEEKRSRK